MSQGEGYPHSRPDGVSVHRGDGWFLEIVNREGDLGDKGPVSGLPAAQAGFHLAPGQSLPLSRPIATRLDVLAELFHVGARAEGRLGAGDHHHPVLRVGLETAKLLDHLPGHLVAQGVPGTRIVHGQDDDTLHPCILVLVCKNHFT